MAQKRYSDASAMPVRLAEEPADSGCCLRTYHDALLYHFV